MRAVYLLVAVCVATYASGYAWPGHPMLYQFSHANALHLAFNMIGLLTFGLGVERERGAMATLVLFLGGATVGWWMERSDAIVGASAGIYSLMVMYAWVKRDAPVMLLVFPMRAMTLVWVLLIAEVVMLAFGWLPNVSHWAHLGGMAFGGGWMLSEWMEGKRDDS